MCIALTAAVLIALVLVCFAPKRNTVPDMPAPRAAEGGYGTLLTESGLCVDLNTADAELLMTLPGIGEKTAQAILDARAEAPFATPEDILRVPGVGEGTLETLRGLIAVSVIP